MNQPLLVDKNVGLFGFWERGEEVEGKFRWKKKRGGEKMLSIGADRMQKARKPGLTEGDRRTC